MFCHAIVASCFSCFLFFRSEATLQSAHKDAQASFGAACGQLGASQVSGRWHSNTGHHMVERPDSAAQPAPE